MADTQLAVGSVPLDALVRCCDEDLARVDIALVNLACAFGLPEAENLDVEALLAKIDVWTDEVRHQTQRQWYRFLADPADYENSAAYFKILVMITVLQRDLGVVYNPARANDPKFQDLECRPDFRDSRDVFIHGILNGPGGTCASMPVLYVAVGRRLGYPLKLVEAKEHLYCRWDDTSGASFPRERFNIEGAGQGFGMYPDAYYEEWPRKPAEFERQAGAYGKSQTPREELAGFISTRGHCLLDNGRTAETIQCFRWSVELAPHDVRYKRQLDSHLNRMVATYYIPQRNPYPAGKVVKVAFGTLPPANLPFGTHVRYVHASELDPESGWQPEPGRVYKIAAGRPLPSWMPPGTPMRIVPANEADDLSAIQQTAAPSSPFAPMTHPPQLAFGHIQPNLGIPFMGRAGRFPGLPGS